MPDIERSLRALSAEIQAIVAPNLRGMRNSYSQLADKRAEVREALGLHQMLKDLEDRKAKLEGDDEKSGDAVSMLDGLQLRRPTSSQR